MLHFFATITEDASDCPSELHQYLPYLTMKYNYLQKIVNCWKDMKQITIDNIRRNIYWGVTPNATLPEYVILLPL